MFLEEVKQSFIAQAKAIAEKRNDIAAEEYLGACRNWAARRQQGVDAAQKAIKTKRDALVAMALGA